MKLREDEYIDDLPTMEKIPRKKIRALDDEYHLPPIGQPPAEYISRLHTPMQLAEITNNFRSQFIINDYPDKILQGCAIFEKSLIQLMRVIEQVDISRSIRDAALEEYCDLVNVIHKLSSRQFMSLQQKELKIESPRFEGYDQTDGKNLRLSIQQRLVREYSPKIDKFARSSCQIRISRMEEERSKRGYAIGQSGAIVRFGLRPQFNRESGVWTVSVESGIREFNSENSWKRIHPLSQVIEAAKLQGIEGLSTRDGEHTFHYHYERSRRRSYRAVDEEFGDFNWALFKHFISCQAPYQRFGSEERRNHKNGRTH